MTGKSGRNRTYAFLIHLFTATGAGLALFAMLAAGQKDWTAMYLWLLAALIVDGIDGPLARHFEVKKYAPEWDGALLDLIIDYLTYVFIPAYALAQSGLLPAWEGWFSAIFITLTSAVYFSDTRMKTADNAFNGFPGCWNMVVLVFFALEPPVWVMIATIVVLGLLQFFPVHFVHPVRTRKLRWLSLPMMVLWIVIAIWIGWSQFETAPLARSLLLIASAYLLLVGGVLQMFDRKS